MSLIVTDSSTFKAVQHQVQLGISKNLSINSVLHRVCPMERELEKLEIETMLAMDAIQPVQTAWTFPIMFVPKKDARFASGSTTEIRTQ